MVAHSMATKPPTAKPQPYIPTRAMESMTPSARMWLGGPKRSTSGVDYAAHSASTEADDESAEYAECSLAWKETDDESSEYVVCMLSSQRADDESGELAECSLATHIGRNGRTTW
uniref:Uncharacterized protein n=1 Tax=Phytophthora fragariae TaxID=53985 RepID=A0A6A3DTH8_9STRA|nr:hypothetical protein PF009_g25422 [Phytophthora fragariae]